MVIDCFSKFLFVTPLKRKTTESIIDGFKTIFNTTDRRPERLQTDKGGEYDSRKFKTFMKDNDIRYNTTNNPDIKCSIAERVIRTIKTKIFKYLTHVNSYRYIDVLDQTVKSYNSDYHRTIRMSPIEVNEKNIVQVYENIRKSQNLSSATSSRLRIGDYVRISKNKKTFAKGYTPNWTEEVFRIKSIVKSAQPVYYLVDLGGEDIEGRFYDAEVQKIIYDETAAWAIEKIIKQRRQGKNIQYYVKWRGYPTKFNSWIDAKTVSSI